MKQKLLTLIDKMFNFDNLMMMLFFCLVFLIALFVSVVIVYILGFI